MGLRACPLRTSKSLTKEGPNMLPDITLYRESFAPLEAFERGMIRKIHDATGGQSIHPAAWPCDHINTAQKLAAWGWAS